ncbi:Cerevisin [Nakaseomyces glabratus]|uniref:Cerevisin n=1 Tax=Candida glabrata TaxID=5478 RepID=A0A0W0CI99_CANGB|nr:Subtilase family [Nakaseomyces glabratus]KAH7594303.1 Subtilase family [Nakaseomyces glabratus]KAH7611491.1 Subtilase family [Nakaseomyces glabratus]KTA99284.1 Cerevisin [Nakaseomyces glabratus]KTB02366.1 Cerevisin [Nakaseomyces glabratus]
MRLSNIITLVIGIISLSNAIVLPDIHTLEQTSESQEYDNFFKQSKRPGNVKAPLVAPLGENDEIQNNIVPYRYIVMFKNFAYTNEIKLHIQTVAKLQLRGSISLAPNDPFFHHTRDKEFSTEELGGVLYTFDIGSGFNGYVGYFTDEVVEFIRKQSIVDYVEMDSILTIDDKETDSNSHWHLARISHRPKLGLSNFNEYKFDPNGGQNIDAYILDTGVYQTHAYYIERTIRGIVITPNEDERDMNGHGTEMAGLVGGREVGVARKATLIDVKVLNWQGRGTVSNIIKGLSFVNHHHPQRIEKNGVLGAVVLFSISGAKSRSLNTAFDKMVSSGIHVVVGAGTKGINACNSSPASSSKPITVAGMSITDEPIDRGNWGSCVDIYGPGDRVRTTYPNLERNQFTNEISVTGSSAAAAQVAGLLAYFASLQPGLGTPDVIPLTPEELKERLIDFGTKGKLTNLERMSPNIIAFNGAGGNLDSFFNDGSEIVPTATKNVDPSDVPTETASPTGINTPVPPLPVDPENPEEPSNPEDPENPNDPTNPDDPADPPVDTPPRKLLYREKQQYFVNLKNFVDRVNRF